MVEVDDAAEGAKARVSHLDEQGEVTWSKNYAFPGDAGGEASVTVHETTGELSIENSLTVPVVLRRGDGSVIGEVESGDSAVLSINP